MTAVAAARWRFPSDRGAIGRRPAFDRRRALPRRRRGSHRGAVQETETLPLSRDTKRPGARPPGYVVGVFGVGIALAAFGLAPQIAFGLVVLVLAAAGILNLRTALADLNWPILIMLAAMIPLGVAVETTGAAGVLADALLAALPSLAPVLLVGAILLLAVVLTPFINNASTAIVLGPIAIAIANSAGLPVEPLLIAVALGVSIDFLTPFGHHNNTLVMGLGGYRFAEFGKAGWPLTAMAFAVGLACVSIVWL